MLKAMLPTRDMIMNASHPGERNPRWWMSHANSSMSRNAHEDQRQGIGKCSLERCRLQERMVKEHTVRDNEPEDGDYEQKPLLGFRKRFHRGCSFIPQPASSTVFATCSTPARQAPV